MLAAGYRFRVGNKQERGSVVGSNLVEVFSVRREREHRGVWFGLTDSITETPFFLGTPLAPAGKNVEKNEGSSFFMSTSRSLLLLRICFLGSTGFSGPLAA